MNCIYYFLYSRSNISVKNLILKQNEMEKSNNIFKLISITKTQNNPLVRFECGASNRNDSKEKKKEKCGKHNQK